MSVKLVIKKTNHTVEVPEAAANAIGHVYEFRAAAQKEATEAEEVSANDAAANTILIPDVITDYALDRVAEWVRVHSEGKRLPRLERPLTKPLRELLTAEFDKDFLNSLAPDDSGSDPKKIDELLQVAHAANVLKIADLGHLCAAEVASIVRGKSTEQLRTIFGLVDNFTPEERKVIQEEEKYVRES